MIKIFTCWVLDSSALEILDTAVLLLIAPFYTAWSGLLITYVGILFALAQAFPLILKTSPSNSTL